MGVAVAVAIGDDADDDDEPDAVANAIGYAMHHSRSDAAVIRVYDAAGNMIEKHEHVG